MTNKQIIERLIEEIDTSSINDLILIKYKCIVAASMINNTILCNIIESIDCNSRDYITRIKNLLYFTKTIIKNERNS